MPPKKDLIGTRFGRLIVIENLGKIDSNYQWLCKCDCGNTIVRCTSVLGTGHTKSCGCYRKSGEYTKTHGQSKTRLYRIWKEMRRRCLNPNDREWQYYGGRGIIVHEDWIHNFETFQDWALNTGYKNDLTIDRIDTNGNYCPENCRWVDMKTQSRNRRSNTHIICHGEDHIIVEWSELLGVHYTTVFNEYKKYGNIDRLYEKYHKD